MKEYVITAISFDIEIAKVTIVSDNATEAITEAKECFEAIGKSYSSIDILINSIKK